jgi:hypothetical protein
MHEATALSRADMRTAGSGSEPLLMQWRSAAQCVHWHAAATVSVLLPSSLHKSQRVIRRPLLRDILHMLLHLSPSTRSDFFPGVVCTRYVLNPPAKLAAVMSELVSGMRANAQAAVRLTLRATAWRCFVCR